MEAGWHPWQQRRLQAPSAVVTKTEGEDGAEHGAKGVDGGSGGQEERQEAEVQEQEQEQEQEEMAIAPRLGDRRSGRRRARAGRAGRWGGV